MGQSSSLVNNIVQNLHHDLKGPRLTAKLLAATVLSSNHFIVIKKRNHSQTYLVFLIGKW